MIRIDEIYYNTFLPRLQRPNHGLHWFDPFGSVEFEDLCNVPAIHVHEQATRYLFWDQEPLHRSTVDQTIGKFTQVFPYGQRHIITSERDSENVEYVQNTYGFKPHYYFFHGWAALDWFRGYNRSYLMPEPQDRTITGTFIMPNRIIGGARQHRLILLYYIFKYHLIGNYFSCPDICPAENISIYEAIKPLKDAYPDIEEVFRHSGFRFPVRFTGEAEDTMHSYQLSLFRQSAQSLLYLVTETVATGRRQHLTEKTFKPICLRMPFIIAGTAGSLKYLKSYGFRTFDHLWDESYDDEINDHQRMEKIGWVLRALDSTPLEEKQRLFNEAQEICEYNYNHFYNGGFEKILWAELQGMINEF